MRQKRSKRSLLILAVSFFLVGLVGCIAEDVAPERNERATGEEITVDLQFSTPAMDQKPGTRAMSPEDEKAIRTLDVLVFHAAQTSGVAGERASTFAYRANVLERKENTPSTGITSVRLKLKASTNNEKYYLMLYANLPEAARTRLGAELFVGMSKEEVNTLLTASFADKWDATEGVASIPMWGESNDTQINSTTTVFADFGVTSPTESSPIKLLRALARVDVGLKFGTPVESETVTGLTGFKLKSVSVYGFQKSYSPLFFRAQMSNGLPQVLSTAPENSWAYTEKSLVYTLPDAGNSYIREIYIPEAHNTGKYCLVIGGYYGEGNTTKETFYRVDFLDSNQPEDQQPAYIDVNRNHRYRFNISKVSGQGFDTKEEALRSLSSSIQFNVTVWNESSVKEVKYDGQYMLGVSQKSLELYKESGSNTDKNQTKVVVRTDWPEGWKAVVSQGADFITLTTAAGAANTDGSLAFTYTANNTGVDRIGEITVTAGRMSWKVTVRQLAVSGLSLELLDANGKSIDNMEFPSTGVTAQSLQVRWSPGTSAPQVTALPGGYTFTGSPSGTVSGSGTSTYNISPGEMTVDPVNPFKSRDNVLTFTLQGADGRRIVKTLVLHQYNYNAFVENAAGVSLMDSKGFYALDGTTPNISVKANTPYKLTLVSQTPDIKYGGTGSPISGFNEKVGNGVVAGESVPLTLSNDIQTPVFYYGIATFKLESTSSPARFAPKTFTVTLASAMPQPEANSYLLSPSKKLGLLIPVSRERTYLASGFAPAGTQPVITDAGTFSAGMVWSTSPSLQATSPVRIVKAAKQGRSGYVLVMPGTAVGSSVVYAGDVAGNKGWSWHIWSTEYSVDGAASGAWMDRNLGALRGTPVGSENYATVGMYYQWGRKDPFPGPANQAANTPRTIYYGNANTPGNLKEYKGKLTLTLSIDSPEYYANSNGEDWATPNSTDFWQNGSKTVFDPCPAGWRVLRSYDFPTSGRGTWANNGLTYNGSYFPGSGNINDRTGKLEFFPQYGYLWTSNGYGPNRSTYFECNDRAGDNFRTTESYYGRAMCFPVRCIKE